MITLKTKIWLYDGSFWCDTVTYLQMQLWNVALALWWAGIPQCFLFLSPLGAVSQVNQHLDSLGKPAQPLILQDELGGTQWILGGEKERSKQMQWKQIFCPKFYGLNFGSITDNLTMISNKLCITVVCIILKN